MAFKKRLNAIVITACIFSLLMVMMTLSVTQTNAGIGPKPVRGFVWDSLGNEIAGANVTINIRLPDTTLRSTLNDTTNSTGFYAVTFGPSDWIVGDTIEVIATFGVDSNTNSTIITSEGVEYVNVTISMIIPEFGSLGSMSITIMSIFVATIILVSRRRNQR